MSPSLLSLRGLRLRPVPQRLGLFAHLSDGMAPLDWFRVSDPKHPKPYELRVVKQYCFSKNDP